MRNIIIIVSILVLNIHSLFSQDNVAKIGIVDLGKINLSYERVINDNQSFNFNFAFLPGRSVPNALLPDDTQELNLDSKYSGFSILPEYRFYLSSKKSPRGFYIGTYAKFSNYSISFHDSYNGKDLIVDGKYTSFGLGAQLGVHWIISDVFSIDWYFIGAEIDRNSFSLDFTSEDNGINFKSLRNQISEDYSDIPILGDKMIVTSGENFVESSASFIFPGLRTGISIGFAF